MIRPDPEFPWRVTAISVALFAVVAFVAWSIFGPVSTPPVEVGDPAATESPPDPGSLPEELDPEQAPGLESGDGTDQLASPGVVELDPSSPEARAFLARERTNAGIMELQLFLVVPGVERLIPVAHNAPAPAGIDAQVKSAVRELIDWSGADAITPLPSQANVREVWISPGGIAYVDFDQNFYVFSGSGSLGELHTVYSVVTTLTTSFPEIRAVQILIDGEAVDTLAGHVDLSRPLLPSAEWALLESGERQLREPLGG